MWSGTLFALTAGLVWGLVFVAPVLLPQYPAPLLAAGRYVAFGLIALPLAWMDRAHLRQFQRADWLEALKLALVGNLLYYTCLAASIQLAGAPLPTLIIGTLPVVIALTAHHRNPDGEERLTLRRLGPSLLLIGTGLMLVHRAEMAVLRTEGRFDASAYATGALLAVVSVVCWTWYPLRNDAWLRAHPDLHPRAWATAQGLTTLLPALLGYLAFGGWAAWSGLAFDWPLGPQPATFILVMFSIGLLASWVGTLCWNKASQRLPPAIAGQLIVFETLAALAYSLTLRGTWPDPGTLVGAALLVAGVVWALSGRSRIQPARADTARPHSGR